MRRRFVRVAAGACALALVVTAFVGLRDARVLDALPGSLFALGFLVVAGTVAGHAAQLVRLPRITGYLLAGLAAGPHGFALLDAAAVKDLGLVNGLALAIIALLAGAEITTQVLARTWKSVLVSSIFQVLLVAAPMAVVFYLLAPRMHFAAGLSAAGVAAIAGVWGVIALSRSPSVTLGVLAETRAKGPLVENALGIVVLLDVLVLALFSFAMAAARTQIVGAPFEAERLLDLAEELFASVAAGTTFGLFIATWFRFVRQERILFVVVVGYAITAFTKWFHYDTLLVFVVAGFVVMNLTRFGPELVHTSEKLGAAVMTVFFATAGAKIDLDALQALWRVVLILAFLRIVFTYVSVKLATRVARDPPSVQRYGWLPLVSQAGVTIGLATIVADGLPKVGGALATLAIAVVGVNEILGPVCFKWALARAGEIPPAVEDDARAPGA